MNRPTLEECKAIICERAVQAATRILDQRGMTFHTAESLRDVREIFSSEVQRLKDEEDLIGATACLMQLYHHFEQNPDIQELAKLHAKWLSQYASNAFYDRGDQNSMLYLQLAAGLDPDNALVLWEVIAPCLQGSPQRPREALPYAILVAYLNPKRDEVAYVEELIRDEELREIQRLSANHMNELSGDWLTAGGNNRRTGVSQARIKPPLEMRWCCREIFLPKGGIVISRGIAVCGHWSRENFNALIHGVKIRDGQKLWTYPMKGIVDGTPAIKGEYVYTGNATFAVCLKLSTGEEVWKTSAGKKQDDIPIAMMGCPLCIGELVLYCDEEVKAFDAQTGEVVFQQQGSRDPRGNVGPCTDGKSLYFPCERSIVRLNLQSGRLETTAYTNGKVSAGPVLAGDLLIYGSSRSMVEALDIQTWETVWTFEAEDPLYYEFSGAAVDSAFACSHNRVYFGGPDGNVYALDYKTGKRLWKYQTGAPVDSSPIVSGEIVYVMTGNKGLCALSAENGKLKWQHGFGEITTGNSPNPAICGSVILAGADYLYAFASADD